MDALTELLGLASPAIAIGFVDTPPVGITRVAFGGPASCEYWTRAARGEIFYTTANDHKACPVGAYTHHVITSSAEQQQLSALIQKMAGLSYIRLTEVPSIPRREQPLKVALYAPLSTAPFLPDVVLMRGHARQLMMLTEAAQRAGIFGVRPAIRWPTCAVLPVAIGTQTVAASFACAGNRVYTGAAESEAYAAVPGEHLGPLVDSLRIVVRANDTLEQFHRQRLAAAW